MKTKKLFVVLLLFIGLSGFTQNADDAKVIEDAERAKAAFLETNPKLKAYFDDAQAYAIFPNVGKGAFIVGAATGNGAVYKNGVLVGMSNLKQVDVGAQIGGKAYSEIVFLKTDQAVKEFMNGKFKFSGNVSAIAIDKSTPTLNLKYDNGVAVFTLPKEGLMAEVSVGGQHFDFRRLD